VPWVLLRRHLNPRSASNWARKESRYKRNLLSRKNTLISPVNGGGEEDELTPLQRVSISELQLVGIIKDPEGNRALIQTPDGRGYFLRVGVQVGKNNGIVEKILADRVVIREKKADFLGQINVSEEVLELKKEEGNR
jgi:type IV pilus assembly protein PilP